MKKLIFINFLTLFITQNSYASKVIIISDIDDTIKASHILSPSRGVVAASFIEAAFPGMALLYKNLLKGFSDNSNEAKIYYVTNAPEFLMKNRHEKFLHFNQFPNGEIKFSKLGDKMHKYKAIEEIIKKEAPNRIILIGDNGQNDVYFYNEVTQKYKDSEIEFKTYIRLLYKINNNASKDMNVGKPLFNHQINFVLPTDIAIDFYKEGIFNINDLELLLNDEKNPDKFINRRIKTDSKTKLPHWYDCRDYIPPEIPIELNDSQLIYSFYEEIKKRCKLDPKEIK